MPDHRNIDRAALYPTVWYSTRSTESACVQDEYAGFILRNDAFTIVPQGRVWLIYSSGRPHVVEVRRQSAPEAGRHTFYDYSTRTNSSKYALVLIHVLKYTKPAPLQVSRNLP